MMLEQYKDCSCEVCYHVKECPFVQCIQIESRTVSETEMVCADCMEKKKEKKRKRKVRSTPGRMEKRRKEKSEDGGW